jgi:hypothetical protein
MRVITAKFDSKCAETGRPIKKGDACVYDPQTKKITKISIDNCGMEGEPKYFASTHAT